MLQSPLLWKLTNSSSTSQEISHILWNQKVHDHIHKIPPSVPMLSQINPVSTIPSCFFQIYFNIILPPTPRSSKQSVFFRFSSHIPGYVSLLPNVYHMPCSPHSPSHFHVNNTLWGAQTGKIFINFLQSPATFYLLHSSISFSTLFSNTLILQSPLNMILSFI